MTQQEIVKNILLDRTCDICKFDMFNKCIKTEADIPKVNTCRKWEKFVGLTSDILKVVRRGYLNIIVNDLID